MFKTECHNAGSMEDEFAAMALEIETREGKGHDLFIEVTKQKDNHSLRKFSLEVGLKNFMDRTFIPCAVKQSCLMDF